MMKVGNKTSVSRKVFYVCNVLFLLIFCATILFPYLNLLAKSFNDGADTAKGGIWLWPREFTLENYETVFNNKQFGPAFCLSIARVVINVVVNVFVQFVVAYVFLNKEFLGRKGFMIYFLIPMYFSGGIICNYILYSQLGLMNTFWVYILPGAFSVYNMIIIRSYLESIPASIRESATIDGANDLTIAFRIMFPLAKPVLATVALWTAVGSWNDWTTTMYYVTKPKLYTLQYLMMRVLKESETIQSMINDAALMGRELNIIPAVTPESIQAAQLIITTIPIVLSYPFLQKYFIQGMTLGAVKD